MRIQAFYHLPALSLPAAHCFFDEALGAAVNSTSDYEIVVSKETRDYKKFDNNFQKKYEVPIAVDSHIWG